MYNHTILLNKTRKGRAIMARKPKHLINRASLTSIIEVRELLTTPDPENSRKKVLVPVSYTHLTLPTIYSV